MVLVVQVCNEYMPLPLNPLWREEKESNPLVLGAIANSVGKGEWVNNITVLERTKVGCLECSRNIVPTFSIVFIYAADPLSTYFQEDCWKMIATYEEDHVFFIRSLFRVEEVERTVTVVTYEPKEKNEN